MIYQNTPNPKNTYAKILALVSLLLGAGLFIVSNLNILDAPAVPQLFGLILITVSIFVASLYLIRQYTFSIDLNPTSETDELDFIITERKGKRDVTVCRIGISDMKMGREVNAQNKKRVAEERKKMKRYTYDTTFLPSKRIELVFKIDEEFYSLLVTYDEFLLEDIVNCLRNK